MVLEDYFDFLAPDDIRLKGTRVGMETVLYDHIHRGMTPEAIAQAYPSLSLEQVYATLLYYHSHKAAAEEYLAKWLEFGRTAREEQARTPGFLRLRQKLQTHKAARPAVQA